MALMKLCSYRNCHVLVPYGVMYCEEHKDIVEQERKQSYIQYKRNRTDIKEQKFYDSKEWRMVRSRVLAHYNNMDIYQYYINHRVINADMIHHIIEIKDIGGWEKRVYIPNLFPISKRMSHNTIHAEYDKGKKDKTDMQKLLRELLDRYNKEFN